jgi:hypothetical protein
MPYSILLSFYANILLSYCLFITIYIHTHIHTHSINDICAALSSHSLPKLKKKFQKGEGLPIGMYTIYTIYYIYYIYTYTLVRIYIYTYTLIHIYIYTHIH